MPKTKDHRITIRFTPEEYAVIEAKAGAQALSTFIRDAALNKAAQKRMPSRRVGLDQAQVAQILALLGQNDLVHAFKTSANAMDEGFIDTDEVTHRAVLEGRDFLQKILAMLLNAQGVKA